MKTYIGYLFHFHLLTSLFSETPSALSGQQHRGGFLCAKNREPNGSLRMLLSFIPALAPHNIPWENIAAFRARPLPLNGFRRFDQRHNRLRLLDLLLSIRQGHNEQISRSAKENRDPEIASVLKAFHTSDLIKTVT